MDTKKQVPLRISSKLYEQIAAWAEDDFRSINGQIEYLLSECVRKRKKADSVSENNPANDQL
ncbi:MAG: PTS ascorbate transporter subunit IIC [Clostridiaceae bacterium]|nr:PTS ascorbate transporter subunit IIC [Clostridiaceae bacterium]